MFFLGDIWCSLYQQNATENIWLKIEVTVKRQRIHFDTRELAGGNRFHGGDHFGGNTRVAGPLCAVLGCQQVVGKAGHPHALSMIPLLAAAFAVNPLILIPNLKPTRTARILSQPLFLLLRVERMYI